MSESHRIGGSDEPAAAWSEMPVPQYKSAFGMLHGVLHGVLRGMLHGMLQGMLHGAVWYACMVGSIDCDQRRTIDGDGWEEAVLNDEVPIDIQTDDDIACWVKTRVPNAIGFARHPDFLIQQHLAHVTAIIREGQHTEDMAAGNEAWFVSRPGDKWPLFLYTAEVGHGS